MTTEVVEAKLGSLTSWVTAGLVFIVVFSISISGVLLWYARDNAAQARDIAAVTKDTHSALCAFKLDLIKRHNASRDFADEHPEGLLSDSGKVLISPEQIQASLDAQEGTIASLRILNCK